MILKKLSFKNFKNWKSFETDLSKINLFFGQNSSGKSSIIQLLLLLKQTAENRDDKIVLHFGDDRSLVNLGNFDEILNKDSKSTSLSFELTYSYWLRNWVFDAEIIKNDVGIIEINALSFKNINNNLQINVQKNKSDYTLSLNNENNNTVVIPSINKFYGLPYQVVKEKRINDNIFEFGYDLKKLFDNIIYIGPLREFPKREYKWTGTKPSDFGIRGENTFDAIITTFHKNDKFTSKFHNFSGTLAEIVCKWLIEFDMAEDFQIIPISDQKQLYQVNVKTKGAKNWVDICDVGFGVSQILPIIALCYYAPDDSIIIIEQPEIHLHPKVQSGIGDLLIDASTSKNIQFIIESHSEHLLTRIQRRIAEQLIDDKDVKVNFCKLENGESKIEALIVNDFGEIQNWPDNFFGDEMGEIYQMQHAILDRKIKPKKSSNKENELLF